MNMVLLYETDFVDEHRVLLSDYRYEHIKNVLKKEQGHTIKIGLFNCRMGTGNITHLDNKNCTILCDFNQTPPEPLHCTIILALPRPKMFKRTLFSLISLGIKKIYIINTWKVDKSYWQSPGLSETSLQKIIYKALEQSCDTIQPVIHFKKLFRPFVEDELKSIIENTQALIAHPGGETIDAADINIAEKSISLAIGPEGGFNDFEIALLQKAGFTTFSTGKRILRVEDAVPSIIGKLLL